MSDQQQELEHPSTPHGKPEEGMCCLCTMEDITEKDGNYVEYQSFPSMVWKPAFFEKEIVQQLLDSQFQQFLDKVQKTDCKAELRRLVTQGPPIYISDKHAFPLADGEFDSHVCKLWFAEDGIERSAKLKGALDGQEREDLWKCLKQILSDMEAKVEDEVSSPKP
jgi:hypothetical protein